MAPSEEPIPRYLWGMTYTAGEAKDSVAAAPSGIHEFRSDAVESGDPTVRLEMMPDDEARESLARFAKRDPTFRSTLIPFTSSLLLLLHRALQDAHRMGRGDSQWLTASSVSVYMVDTTQAPPQTFASAATSLRQLGVDEGDASGPVHAEIPATYFAQGSFRIPDEGVSHCRPLTSLVQAGMFDLLVGHSLPDILYSVFGNLSQARNNWLLGAAVRITSYQWDRSQGIAGTFGARFVRPVLISLLALKRRSSRDPYWQAKNFESQVDSMPGELLETERRTGVFWQVNGVGGVSESLPEVRQVCQIMSDIAQRRWTHDGEQLHDVLIDLCMAGDMAELRGEFTETDNQGGEAATAD